VLLQRQRDKYEKEEEEEKARNSPPPKAQQGKPVLDRYQPNSGGGAGSATNLNLNPNTANDKHEDDVKERDLGLKSVGVGPRSASPYANLPPPSSYSIRLDDSMSSSLDQSTVKKKKNNHLMKKTDG
jgi:hypothetical protein